MTEPRLGGRLRRLLLANVGVQLVALVAVTLATLVLARDSGAALVGDYTLLRLLPWVVGLALSGGLPPAVSYFLSGPRGDDPRLRPTIVAVSLLAGIVGGLAWWLAAPLTARLFFANLPVALVAWSSLKVLTRLQVVTGKASSQGFNDLSGSHLVMVLEEATFLPCYVVLRAAGADPGAALVLGLVLADIVTGSATWLRLARRGFFRDVTRPSIELARRLYSFGTRGQVGNFFTLLNLRFDFIFLSILAGPVTLGIYAIASKYAELLRLLPVAFTWVLYPQFAREGHEASSAHARRLLPRAGAVTLLGAVPLALAAGAVIPLIYGGSFSTAVGVSRVLLVGLALEGAAGVASAYLLGNGRPGLNSLASGSGLAVTVVLDMLLIPRLGAAGAAMASVPAYLTTTTVLVGCFLAVSRGRTAGTGPGIARRAMDIVIAGTCLVLCAPLIVVLAAMVRLTSPGPAIFRQCRFGQGGVPFTMYKLRTMTVNPGGSELTAKADPRVTRLGRLLRSTSLDELPQLLNVLRGDMTLVGPRPETVALAERYPEDCHWIFQHRPGVTGLVQVRMRNDAAAGVGAEAEARYLTELVPRRVALDAEYLADPGLGRTIAIVAETARHVVMRSAIEPEWRARFGDGTAE
jgi:lipopolysaccharide/colanic/teichoic acid biosynthesis glycosyltransferase